MEHLRVSREGDDKFTFTCEFHKGGDVYWVVDDVCYKCTTSPHEIEPETNGCFTKNGKSLFYLRNLTTFNKRTLSLQCVLYKFEGKNSL